VTTPVATPASSAAVRAADTTGHVAFLLLLGQVVGVVILAWIAGTDDRIGTVVVAFFVVLWLIFLMNRSDLIKTWGAKVGL
jgi:hypothetical protein